MLRQDTFEDVAAVWQDFKSIVIDFSNDTGPFVEPQTTSTESDGIPIGIGTPRTAIRAIEFITIASATPGRIQRLSEATVIGDEDILCIEIIDPDTV